MNVAEIADAFLTIAILSQAGAMSSMDDVKLKALMEVAQGQWDKHEAPDTITHVATICSNYKTAETDQLVNALRVTETVSMRAVAIYLISTADDYSIPPAVVLDYIKQQNAIVAAVTHAIRHRMIHMWIGMPVEDLMDAIKTRIEAEEGAGEGGEAAAVSLDPFVPPGTTIQ